MRQIGCLLTLERFSELERHAIAFADSSIIFSVLLAHAKVWWQSPDASWMHSRIARIGVDLAARDEFQFMMSMHVAILGMQNSYLLVKEGTLDPEFREAVATAIVAVKDLPGMARYWRQRRGFFHTEFAKYVDGLLVRDAIDTLDIYKSSDADAGY